MPTPGSDCYASLHMVATACLIPPFHVLHVASHACHMLIIVATAHAAGGAMARHVSGAMYVATRERRHDVITTSLIRGGIAPASCAIERLFPSALVVVASDAMLHHAAASRPPPLLPPQGIFAHGSVVL